MGQQDPGSDPTPEEIRMRCRNIQRGWSEDQEKARRRGSNGYQPVVFEEVPGRLLGLDDLDR